MDKQRFLNFALIFVITLLILQLFMQPPTEEPPGSRDDLEIMGETSFSVGEVVAFQLRNNTAEVLEFSKHCPQAPFTLQKYANGEFSVITGESQDCQPVTSLLPGATQRVSYQDFQAQIFQEPGKYRLEIPLQEKVFAREFTIEQPGIFGQMWQAVVYRPIFNALIFFTDFAQSSLGLGIVLLTIVLRLLLYIPFQKSLKSQRKLQRIQPEIENIKKKFKGNQQMIAMETMALMKRHKVSPLGSCLPVLLQIPFLLAVFWITYDGLGPNTLPYLYEGLRDFDFTQVTTSFLGLELTSPGYQLFFILPLVIAGLQFGQMKLALHHTHSKKPPAGGNPFQEAMHSMSKMMPYILPVMIAFFTATMPAAVGIYWGTSTIFGIFQQLIVNKEVR